MTIASKLAKVTIQVASVSALMLILSGCFVRDHFSQDCSGCTADPVVCADYAINVTQANSPSGCIVNPGVSKKCSATNLRCPYSYSTTYCRTVVGPGGNCSCQCPS